jgi:hypothetical protein
MQHDYPSDIKEGIGEAFEARNDKSNPYMFPPLTPLVLPNDEISHTFDKNNV